MSTTAISDPVSSRVGVVPVSPAARSVAMSGEDSVLSGSMAGLDVSADTRLMGSTANSSASSSRVTASVSNGESNHTGSNRRSATTPVKSAKSRSNSVQAVSVNSPVSRGAGDVKMGGRSMSVTSSSSKSPRNSGSEVKSVKTVSPSRGQSRAAHISALLDRPNPSSL